MASAFAHAAVGAALWPWFRVARAPRFTYALGAALAVAPDVDVLGFRFGIEYGAPLGHRGLTHSLVVALVAGGVLGWVLTRDWDDARERMRLAGYLVAALASHGLLDAMTDGGLGVALFAPFDGTRYFFPWRPISVSPIGVQPFFTRRGLEVLANETLWVGLPSLAIAWIGTRMRPNQSPS